MATRNTKNKAQKIEEKQQETLNLPNGCIYKG
jgi:hypothetical protein